MAVPLVGFLSAALTLAGLAERAGLARRVATALADLARGNTRALYWLVCALSLALTAAVSLDGAVVLMVPLVVVLADRTRVPVRPLFLGMIVVANAASLALPAGNPTNLVLIERLGLSPLAFAAHMLLPGLAAAGLGAAAVAWIERRATPRRYRPWSQARTRLSRRERHAALSLAAAAAAAWAAPLVGIAPWWAFAAVAVPAVALSGERPRVIVPWRITAQVAALVVIVSSVGLGAPVPPPGALGLVAVVALIGLAAAIMNNLPASVWAAALIAGPSGYAASIGLALGALATPHGSVATLIASDLAGDEAPAIPRAAFALIGGAALAAAGAVLWLGL
jgi:arsenical pump membrane protein